MHLLSILLTGPVETSESPYRNKGWDLYVDMQQLMPSHGKGENVFRPSQSAPKGAVPSSPSSSGGESPRRDNGSSSPDENHPPPPSSLPPSPPKTDKGKKCKGTPGLASPSMSDLTVSSLVTTESSSKRARITGPVALNGIKEEMSIFNNTIRTMSEHKMCRLDNLPPPLPTDNQLRQEAQNLLQEKDTYLDDDSMIAMFDLFAENAVQAQTYLGIRRDSLRKLWVKRELEKMNRRLPDFTTPPPPE